MKSSQNPSTPASDVELTLFGLDTHWVRSNDGQWIDKNLREVNHSISHDADLNHKAPLPTHWWQFWKKNEVHN